MITKKSVSYEDAPAQSFSAARNAEKVLRMGSAPVGRLMLEFSIPAVASLVLQAFYNIIDSIFLGQALGDLGLAATTVAAPIQTIMIALSVLAGNGGNAYCAILLGRKKHSDAEVALGNTMLVIIIISLLIALYAFLGLDPLLYICGANSQTVDASRIFTRIILCGCILNNIAFGINNFIRTAGEPNRALWTMFIGTVACIFLNWVFVLCLGWGVVGSAVATVLGQGVSCIFVMYYFTISRKAPFKLKLSCMRPCPHTIARLLILGLAPFALQAALAITQVIGNATIATLGAADPIGQTGAMASIGVVMKITLFMVFPTLGVAVAAQPILGFNIGAQKYERVLRTLYVALAFGTTILTTLFLLIHLFPTQIVGLFGVDDSLMEFAIYALKVQTILIPLGAVQMIGSNYFQATGQPVRATVLSLTRQLIFVLPLYVSAPVFIPALFPQFSALMGFCFAFPISDILSFIVCSIFLLLEIKSLKAKLAKRDASVP